MLLPDWGRFRPPRACPRSPWRAGIEGLFNGDRGRQALHREPDPDKPDRGNRTLTSRIYDASGIKDEGVTGEVRKG